MYAAAGLFVVCLLFCIFSVLYSSFERVTAQNLASQLKEYEQKGKEALEFDEYYKRWKNVDKEFDRFETEYFMKIDGYSKFRSDLNQVFNKYQLKILEQNSKNKYNSLFKDIMVVQMSFTLKGSYTGLKQFIHEMLNQKKIILFRAIELLKDKNSDEVSGNFSMEVYLAK